ncbi:hypothetical protein Bache_0836 [Bacteroides helcogenes P 36-108]|uniref:Uncharacterized protein n=1 Tax=Bacteroides helcogenes (strain ATCC 35417 / DSM 20613 / JCM 6297 / CCUG 15421 / P 36-108) TaxID=693979 RepID=E6SPG4_BACT6|nr:hypothetical protein Bache_0836 [Bacteroides helcogenes P 36-108]
MELNYFYKAEMPNCQDWTLDVSKLNILLIWDRIIQTTIKMNLNNPVPIIRSSNSHKSVESLPALIPSIF